MSNQSHGLRVVRGALIPPSRDGQYTTVSSLANLLVASARQNGQPAFGPRTSPVPAINTSGYFVSTGHVDPLQIEIDKGAHVSDIAPYLGRWIQMLDSGVDFIGVQNYNDVFTAWDCTGTAFILKALDLALEHYGVVWDTSGNIPPFGSIRAARDEHHFLERDGKFYPVEYKVWGQLPGGRATTKTFTRLSVWAPNDGDDDNDEHHNAVRVGHHIFPGQEFDIEIL